MTDFITVIIEQQHGGSKAIIALRGGTREFERQPAATAADSSPWSAHGMPWNAVVG